MNVDRLTYLRNTARIPSSIPYHLTGTHNSVLPVYPTRQPNHHPDTNLIPIH